MAAARARKPPPKVLTLEQIVGADDRPTKTVEVPEWGGAVVIRALSKRQQQEVRAASRDTDGNLDANRWEDAMLVASLVEPEVDAAQLALLKEKSGAAVEAIVQAIVELQGGLESALRSFL